jgi:hypothetical protein
MGSIDSSLNLKSVQQILNAVYDSTTGGLKLSGTVAGSLIITGSLTVNGNFDFGAATVQSLFLGDDDEILFGNTSAAPNVRLLWETADANANELILSLPAGGAVDVPVFVIGDDTLYAKDLGLFNGVTNPTIAVVDGAATTALSIQYDNIAFGGLTTSDSFISYDKTMAQMLLLLGSNTGRQLVLGDGAYQGYDYDHAVQAVPTLYIHPSANPDAENRQWVKWYNDGSNSYHLTGIGGHRFGFESIGAKAVLTFTANPTTNLGVVFTVNTGTLTGVTGAPGANQFQFGASLSATLDNLVTAYNLIDGTNVVAHKLGNTVIFESSTVGAAPNSYVTTETTDTDNVYTFQSVLVFTANPTSTGTAQPVIFTVGALTLTGVWSAPVANQFLIGATLPETLTNIVSAYNSSNELGYTAYYDITTQTVYFDAGTTGLSTFTETVDTDNVYSFAKATMWGGRAFSAFMDMQPGYMKLTKQGTATVGTTTYASQYIGLTASGWNTTTSRADDIEFRMQTTGATGASPAGSFYLTRWRNGVQLSTGFSLDINNNFYAGALIGANAGIMQFGQQNAGTGAGQQLWFIGLEKSGAGAGTQFVGYLNYDLRDNAASVAHVFDTKIAQTNAGAKLISIRTANSEKAYMDYLGSFNAGAGTELLPAYSFVGDPNSGIYSAGGDILGFVVGGNEEMRLTATELAPGDSDGAALGSTALMWSDLYLANGGLINFNNGNYTITHSAGLLTTNGALTISGALGGVTNLSMNGTIVGVTTAITGTKNNQLIMSVPDQGTDDANGVGIIIRADDGGSGGTGNHTGGPIMLDLGSKAGTAANGSLQFGLGGSAFGYVIAGGASANILALAGNTADGGTAVGVATGAFNNLTTAGAKILSVRNNISSAGGTEVASIDKTGITLVETNKRVACGGGSTGGTTIANGTVTLEINGTSYYLLTAATA